MAKAVRFGWVVVLPAISGVRVHGFSDYPTARVFFADRLSADLLEFAWFDACWHVVMQRRDHVLRVGRPLLASEVEGWKVRP